MLFGTILTWYGQLIDDISSPFHDQKVPNLNGERRFLRDGVNAGVMEQDAF